MMAGTGKRALVLGLLSVNAWAQDRLPIEVLSIHVHVPNPGFGIPDSIPGPNALSEGLALVHEAMVLLGVPGDRYDLIVSDLEPVIFRCEPPHGYLGVRCESDLIGDVFGDMSAGIENSPGSNLMIRLGHERNAWRYRGTALLGLLIFPDGFYYGGAPSIHGTNQWWSWAGWNPQDLHWSTTSCSVWSVPWRKTIAHELGHCFGLHHTNTDPNTDGIDLRFDLMTSGGEGGNLSIDWLKPSNVHRIQTHFRDLSQPQSIQPTRVIGSAGVALP